MNSANTDVFFGNPAVDDVQRQPYIILSMRRSVDSACSREPCGAALSKSEAEGIRPDSLLEPQYDAQTDDCDNMVTVLLRMQRTEHGISFINAPSGLIMEETLTPYRMYPLAYMSWMKSKNCYHGESPITEAIPESDCHQ